ncbi:MAG: TetR/AcrR family transcriptional regulator [Streptococcaceae bacterium]|nr:TetR/AcrR family transcriptional regulator [Streptococcaceae bacterium]
MMVQRRRGDELKNAIFEATVEILENKGFEEVTFQNVARRAHTTRSVLYRYFEDTFQLIYQAARYHVERDERYEGSVIEQVFNTGALRSDLLAMLSFMRDNSTRFPKNFLPYIFFEQAQGKNFFEGTVGDITENNLIIIERILARAQERGEAREDIKQEAKLISFKLSRYNIMLTGKAMNDAQITELVDDVLIPLYMKN